MSEKRISKVSLLLKKSNTNETLSHRKAKVNDSVPVGIQEYQKNSPWGGHCLEE